MTGAPLDRTELPYVSRLATLALLYKPAAFTDAVHESVVKSRTELYRSVHLRLRVPDRLLGTFELSLPRDPIPLCIPLPLTPRKGVLLDVEDLSATSRGQQLACSIASHDQHVAISKALLEIRFQWTYLRLVPADLEVWNTLISELRKLPAIVTSRPDTAKSIVDGLFSSHRNERHQLRNYTGPLRPADEPRFRGLCDLLAERYLLLAFVEAAVGDELEISYRYRQQYLSEAPVLRRFFGSSTRSVEFYSPLAKYTNHYDFRHTVRDGYFVSSQGAYEKTQQSGKARSLQSGLHPPSTDTPVASIEPGGTSVSHILITNGSKTDRYISVGIESEEMPPGTIGYACAVLALQLFILLVARTVIDYRALEAVDLPALVVALLATLPLVSGVFFGRPDLRRSPLLSRGMLFAGALFGNIFALWITIASSEPSTSTGALKRLVDLLEIWADDVILVMLFILLVPAAIRLLLVTVRFVRASEAK